MDKVVIIGGSGFMGSHTADILSDSNYEVVIYDEIESPWIRDDQKMVLGDILDRNHLRETIKGSRYIYHFAGVADIDDADNNPYQSLNINIMGTATTLEAIVREKNVERFIFASSMYVNSPYGSFYRASKQASEIIIEVYAEKFGIDYTLLRYGSLYGPRSQTWNTLYRYIDQVLREKKLTFWGTGNEKREYIHVRDAAKLSVEVLNSEYKNQAITITGNQILTSNELIEMIFEISGIEKNVDYSNRNVISGHYQLTPYRYTPRKAKKLISNEFTDIGQGIIDLIEAIDIKNDSGKT